MQNNTLFEKKNVNIKQGDNFDTYQNYNKYSQ